MGRHLRDAQRGATGSAAVLVASARSRVEQLDADRFAVEAAQPDAVVVDLRESEERLEGTIRGAVHVPRGLLEFRADPASPYHDARLEPWRRILLHCATGERSVLAAETLEGLGYTHVAHLDGGFAAWRAAGMPVVNAMVQPY
jgi:rhodanese-related sulfurtransferase